MPAHYKGTESEIRALNAYIKLMRATESATARLTVFLSNATKLTVTQFGVLEALYHLGSMCQKNIAQKQLKSSGNITLVIDNLEKRELVKRMRDTEDRRVVTVHLTEKGRCLINAYFPRHAKAIEAEMSALTADEQEELGRLCRKLGLKTSIQP